MDRVVARILKMNSLAAVMSATAFKPLFAGIVALNLLTTGYFVSSGVIVYIVVHKILQYRKNRLKKKKND